MQEGGKCTEHMEQTVRGGGLRDMRIERLVEATSELDLGKGCIDCQAKQPDYLLQAAQQQRCSGVHTCSQVSLTSMGGEETRLFCSLSPSSRSAGRTPEWVRRD